MEYWRIDFSKSTSGACYVERDLLKTMKKKEPILFEALKDRIDTYVSVPIEQIIGPYLELVRDGLWEPKFSLAKNEIRFLGSLSSDRKTFYVLCGYKKKDQRLRKSKIETAFMRMN